MAAIHHKDGWTGSYTFKNGVREGLSKWYYPKGRKGFVNDKNFKEVISGQAMIVSLIKDEAREGLGYSYDNDTGKIFAGLWSKNKIKSGITSYLIDDNTRVRFRELYCDHGDQWWLQEPYSQVLL